MTLNIFLFGNQKELFKSNLKPLFDPSSAGIKRLGYTVGIQFLNDCLVAENSNYLTKIVNAYIAFDLDLWSKNPLKTFTLKNCLNDVINLKT